MNLQNIPKEDLIYLGIFAPPAIMGLFGKQPPKIFDVASGLFALYMVANIIHDASQPVNLTEIAARQPAAKR